MDTFELTAPSYWASYLINGDSSGLNAVEKLACDDWLKANRIFDVLDCVDAGFRWRHDADEFALAGDCQTYTCTIKEELDDFGARVDFEMDKLR
jgi:hypothetical protein